MQSPAKTVEDYLSEIPEERKEVFKKIVSLSRPEPIFLSNTNIYQRQTRRMEGDRHVKKWNGVDKEKGWKCFTPQGNNISFFR